MVMEDRRSGSRAQALPLPQDPSVGLGQSKVVAWAHAYVETRRAVVTRGRLNKFTQTNLFLWGRSIRSHGDRPQVLHGRRPQDRHRPAQQPERLT